MIKRVLALVIDFRTTAEAERLSCQLTGAERDGFSITSVHVDNGNDSPVSLTPEQEELGVRLLRVPHNGGYASGVRRAIQQLRLLGDHYDAFWILNSDLEIEPDCLEKLVAVLNSQPKVAAVGPTVRKGRTERVWGDRGVVSPWLGTTAMEAWPQGGVLPRWSYIPGCSLLVRAAAYDEVGGIPERYGMFYEETHLCVQLQRRGWDLWVEPSAVAYHRVNSMHAGIPAPYQAFYFARNNLYFWKTNFGIPAMVQFPRTVFVVTRDLVLPLRRARSLAEAASRLRYIAMGLSDGFSFPRRRYTHFEKKNFELEPKQPSSVEGMSRSVPTVRIYYPHFPYPATEGSFQVALDQARALAQAGCAVELVSWKDSPAKIARRLNSPSPVPFDPEIRITSLFAGEPRTGSAAEWKSLVEDGAPGAPVETRLHRVRRVASALLSDWASPELFYYPFEADVRDRLPRADVGIYHYSFCYPWLKRNGVPSESRVFVHLHNLESELSRLRSAPSTTLPSAADLVHRINAARLEDHEGRLVRLAQELWFVSTRDRDRVHGGEGAKLRLVPPTFALSLAERRNGAGSGGIAGGGTVDLGFVGGCDFEPNRLSLQWIVERLAPELDARGFTGRIRVAGRGVPDELRARAARYDFFEWLGFVPDLEDYWKSLSFLLTPQVGGSGVRIKLLEAVVSGVPVLANSEAVAALAADVAASPLVTVADDPSGWADLILAEVAPCATRRALAAESFAGTSLDGATTYEFLLESMRIGRQASSLQPGG